MGCECYIYTVEESENKQDIILKYQESVCGYEFLDCLSFSTSELFNIGYNSMKAKTLKKAFKKYKTKPLKEFNEDKDYVVYISY